MKVEANPQNMRQIIGPVIRAIRNGRGLKQKELAELTGVGIMTISAIEKPNYSGTIKLDAYETLCKFLGIEYTIKGGATKEDS